MNVAKSRMETWDKDAGMQVWGHGTQGHKFRDAGMQDPEQKDMRSGMQGGEIRDVGTRRQIKKTDNFLHWMNIQYNVGWQSRVVGWEKWEKFQIFCDRKSAGKGYNWGGGTSVYGQYGDVPLNRVWFLVSVS